MYSVLHQSDRTDRAIVQQTELPNGLLNQFFQSFGWVAWRTVDHHSPFRFQANFTQQPLHGMDANLSAIIPLGQVTLGFRTCDNANPPTAAFQRVHQILRVHLAAAGDFMDHNVSAVLPPLARKRSRLGNRIGTDVDEYVWTFRLRHGTAQWRSVISRDGTEQADTADAEVESALRLAPIQGRRRYYTSRSGLSSMKSAYT